MGKEHFEAFVTGLWKCLVGKVYIIVDNKYHSYIGVALVVPPATVK